MTISVKVSAMLGLLALSGIAQAAEFKITPSIAVNEEYNDNITVERGRHVTDFITQTMPGVAVSFKAPVLTTDINYNFNWLYYAKHSEDYDIYHTLDATARLTVIENLFFIDVGDNYQRTSLDVTRDKTKESLFIDQADRNVFTASPNFIFHPTPLTTVKTGYKFSTTHYNNSQGINQTANFGFFGVNSQGVDKTDHYGFLDVAYEFLPKFSGSVGFNFVREYCSAGDYHQYQPYLGIRYEYASKSFFFAQGGYTWTNYSSRNDLNRVFWNAGINHEFDTATATLNTGVRYDEDPQANVTEETFVIGTFDQRMGNGSVGLSLYYSEFTLPETNRTQTKKYGGIVRGNYDFTSSLKGTMSLTAENYDNPLVISNPFRDGIPLTSSNLVASRTNRFLADAGLSYALKEQLTLSLNYGLVYYHSMGNMADNFHVNRVIVGIKKVF